jgi:hypothetical protein
MPDITVKYLDEMERYIGSVEHGQQFFFAGKSLGLSKLGMNAIRMPPNWEHYPEHDHAADNEEELYIPLGGERGAPRRGADLSNAAWRPDSCRCDHQAQDCSRPRGDDAFDAE